MKQSCRSYNLKSGGTKDHEKIVEKASFLHGILRLKYYISIN